MTVLLVVRVLWVKVSSNERSGVVLGVGTALEGDELTVVQVVVLFVAIVLVGVWEVEDDGNRRSVPVAGNALFGNGEPVLLLMFVGPAGA